MSQEEQNVDIDDEDVEYEESIEDYDPMAILSGLLATEDGETVCTALCTIAKQLETHNKIMVKLLSAVKDLKNNTQV